MTSGEERNLPSAFYVRAQQPIIAIGDAKSHRINYRTSNKTHMDIVQYFLNKNDSPLISPCQNRGRAVASHVTMSILSNITLIPVAVQRRRK